MSQITFDRDTAIAQAVLDTAPGYIQYLVLKDASGKVVHSEKVQSFTVKHHDGVTSVVLDTYTTEAYLEGEVDRFRDVQRAKLELSGIL